ncbi:flagellar export chaperone FliS [Engelhardtia mirabilis]|uniref:Flagellar protein FliS n=1 Tax=Engelhardtia mirabilis TaxID=2528011 RepID=A0A518BSR6_9BACT|nr:Flagellar protein FliS [Planctomycetes bacterium Pla133]QDV04336.1 Flagellar protein FliS [Planctomycetes bacterium Pla86]
MSSKNPVAAYQETSLESAPPIKIVRLLYQSAIRRMEQARRLELPAQVAAFNEAIAKSDAIVTELRFSLDHSHSPDLCQRLEGLYLFVEERLGLAMGERNGEHLLPALTVMRTLLDAWEQVELQVGQAA